VKDVEIARSAESKGAVAVALKPGSIAFGFVADGAQCLERTAPARVERRVDVNQVNAFVGSLGQNRQVVCQDDPTVLHPRQLWGVDSAALWPFKPRFSAPPICTPSWTSSSTATRSRTGRGPACSF